MVDALPICPIPSNSDIAGIRVRVTTYLQACLALFMALSGIVYRISLFSFALWTGERQGDSDSVIVERMFQVHSAFR
ncbi:hypothetical protein DFS33DRAFT_1115149 [Desarmillaria ectypa]|nr:hypothetical protein DFS33DRAFT_1115149 [Desarmillaria ectypa]